MNDFTPNVVAGGNCASSNKDTNENDGYTCPEGWVEYNCETAQGFIRGCPEHWEYMVENWFEPKCCGSDAVTPVSEPCTESNLPFL